MMMGKRTGFEDDGIFYERREYDTKSTWQMMELERIIEDPSATVVHRDDKRVVVIRRPDW
jgi:hypothetical protein